MEKNIFEGAKFRDRFLTRDGTIAIYLRKDGDTYELSTEICDIYSRPDGTDEFTKIGFESNSDIVSRYQEPIDEDKLQDDADMFAEQFDEPTWDDVAEAYKAGYYKAKEE